MLEPITVAFKSIVLIIMCSTTFINAVKEVMAGGNPVDTNMALWYSIISTVGCAIVYFVIDRKGKKLSSDLLNAESNQWLMDTILSAAVLVGFMVSFILSKTSLSYLTIYVDPVMAGGNPVDTNMALWYSIISTVGCATVYFVIDRKGKKLSSDLLNAESNQWLMDTILSAAVLVGFMVSFILSKTSLSYLTIYVDPFMVIISSVIFIRVPVVTLINSFISSVIFIRVPVVTLINSFKEIVNVNADDDINNKIYTIVKDIEEDYNFEDSITRVSKVGRELRIEIDFVFNEESTLNELEEMDKVRERVYKNMAGIKLDKWMNVNFTGDKKWAL